MERIVSSMMKWGSIVLIVFVCSPLKAQQVFKVDNQRLVEILEHSEVQLVDVRTTDEVAKGVIENAKLIDFYDPEFEIKIGQLDKEKPIVVYCAAGARSAKASKVLVKLGFKNIYDLKKGFRGWEIEGYPVVKE